MTSENTYGRKLQLSVGYHDALERVTDALQAEGFGVLTTIDVQATLKAKLDVDHGRYTILGACNPPLAYRALQSEPDIGLLLPCNVIVYEDADGAGTTVSIIDPMAMMSFTGNAALAEVAAQANERLERVVKALAGE